MHFAIAGGVRNPASPTRMYRESTPNQVGHC